MKSKLTLALLVLGTAALVADCARAEVLVSYSYQMDASGTASDSNACFLTTPLADSAEIFGTTVSVGQVFCLAQTIAGVSGPLVCESVVPGQLTLEISPASQAEGTHVCIDPPECTQHSNFNVVTSIGGSFQDAIMANLPVGSSILYTFDSTEGPMSLHGGPSPIPGCPTLGPGYGHVEGYGAMNGFLSVPTATGIDVITTSSASFFNPITQQEVPVEVGLTFSGVTEAGVTTVVAKSSEDAPLDPNFAVEVNGFQSYFFDISTTATITPPITVCFDYPDADNDGFLDGSSLPETELGVLHGEGDPVAFVDRTSGRDVEANQVCGVVDHLSPFAVVPLLPSSPCGVSPRSGCRLAAKGIVTIAHDAGAPDKDKLLWKWIKGAATLQAEFGNPGENTQTALCVFDGDGLVLEAVIEPAATTGTPAKPSWSALNTMGYKFKDKTGTQDGLSLALLKGHGTDPKSKVLVKGGGVTLPDLELSLQGTVTVQLVNNSPAGACFESTFSGSQVRTSSATLFSAKAP